MSLVRICSINISTLLWWVRVSNFFIFLYRFWESNLLKEPKESMLPPMKVYLGCTKRLVLNSAKKTYICIRSRSIVLFCFDFLLQVREAFCLSGVTFSLCRSRNIKDELPSTRSKTVMTSGLKHGDILFLLPHEGAQLFSVPDNQSSLLTSTPGTSTPSTSQSTPSGAYYENRLFNTYLSSAFYTFRIWENFHKVMVFLCFVFCSYHSWPVSPVIESLKVAITFC